MFWASILTWTNPKSSIQHKAPLSSKHCICSKLALWNHKEAHSCQHPSTSYQPKSKESHRESFYVTHQNVLAEVWVTFHSSGWTLPPQLLYSPRNLLHHRNQQSHTNFELKCKQQRINDLWGVIRKRKRINYLPIHQDSQNKHNGRWCCPCQPTLSGFSSLGFLLSCQKDSSNTFALPLRDVKNFSRKDRFLVNLVWI